MILQEIWVQWENLFLDLMKKKDMIFSKSIWTAELKFLIQADRTHMQEESAAAVPQ